MKVKELIKILKKQDPDADVGYSHNDNSYGEVAGWVVSYEIADEETCKQEGVTSLVILCG